MKKEMIKENQGKTFAILNKMVYLQYVQRYNILTHQNQTRQKQTLLEDVWNFTQEDETLEHWQLQQSSDHVGYTLEQRPLRVHKRTTQRCNENVLT